MVSLLVEIVVWAVRIAIVLCVLFAKAVAWSYRQADRSIHAHRTSKDPGASRQASQAMAGGLVAAALGVLVLLGSATGGSSGTGGTPVGPTAAAAAVSSDRPGGNARTAARRAARVEARREVRAERRAAAARAERQAQQRRRARRAARAAAVEHAAAAAAASACDYDPCLEAASDYDCEGGQGDGPEYTGVVRVVGDDLYDLDTDDDGLGCEPS